MNLEELKFLLHKYHLTPNKVRGQNFLISDEVLADILQAADLKASDTVLEVGPGLGALTTRLLAKVTRVVAFEVDKNLQNLLNNLVRLNKNLDLHWQDILSLKERHWQDILARFAESRRAEHKIKNYKIVANIPYYLTAKFINQFLSFKQPPQSMILMLQKEVAERIEIKDGKNSLLSLAVAFYGRAQIVRLVTKNNFFPIPKVDSAILKIDQIKAWQYKEDEKLVWQLIKRGMAHKRKKLFNNLLSDQKIAKDKLSKIFLALKIDQNARAENLNKDLWLKLASEIKKDPTGH
ncbi:MAG: Ribosomal RNA small subunit methyltransferase A [Parcubacteria group bacterium GW2011_GWA2_36_10]|nr:MAG: Ribosomal RNA small subunit methyltransferase A [Parcubacteria group bacterium GW2011_GWA2_36_10]